jgi:hypothetical protein
MAANGEIAARRVRVFEAICRGRTVEDICAAENVSYDTAVRDIRAVQDRLTEWAAERVNGALALVQGQYQRAMTEAWDAYAEQRAILVQWLGGEYDRTEMHPDPDGGMREVRKPPILKLEIAALLGKAIEATREYARVAGLDRADVTVHGDMLLRRYEGDAAAEV